MSIDLCMEDEDGTSEGEVLDPHDLTGRIVTLAGHGSTVPLRFTDACVAHGLQPQPIDKERVA